MRQEKFVTFTMTGASVSTALLASFAKLPIPPSKQKNYELDIVGEKAGVRDPRRPTKEQQRVQEAVEEDGGLKNSPETTTFGVTR